MNMRLITLMLLLIGGTLIGAGSGQARSTFTVKVRVHPNPVRNGAVATATVRTAARAQCVVAIRYADGKVVPGFTGKNGRARIFTVPASGTLVFTWRVQTKSHLGFVAAGCAANVSSSANASAIFNVTQ